MTEVVHERKKLTEAEKKAKYVKNNRTQYARHKAELQTIKALKKKKVPYTQEEKKEKEKIRLETVEEKRIELANKQNPVTRIKIMQEIRKIYRIGGLEELASKTGIFIGHFESWLAPNPFTRPEGKYLKTLQEYFDKH